MINTYRNKIKILIEKDLTDKEIEIYDHIKEQASELIIRHSAEQIAYYLKMYLKYDRIE